MIGPRFESGLVTVYWYSTRPPSDTSPSSFRSSANTSNAPKRSPRLSACEHEVWIESDCVPTPSEASNSVVDPSFELDPDLGRSINLDAFEPLVLAARAAGVKRFIYASSSSVYGVKSEPNVTEDVPLEPLIAPVNSATLIVGGGIAGITAALEIARALGPERADVVIVPTGDGVILSGVAKGFADLVACGLISRAPRLIAAQPEGSSVIARALADPDRGLAPMPGATSVADSLTVEMPRNARLCVARVEESGGAAS